VVYLGFPIYNWDRSVIRRLLVQIVRDEFGEDFNP
jgi:hypothetical protein